MGSTGIHRRNFLKKVGGMGVAGIGISSFMPLSSKQLHEISQAKNRLSPAEAASDETFWYPIQKAYTQSPHFINLEGGYFSPQADEVMEAQFRNIRMINEQPSFYMRRRQFEERLAVKKKLARMAGVSHEEIVITRNTTEALNIVIMGKKWQVGDEVIVSSQDYGSMLEAFEMRELRDGVKRVMVDLPLNPQSDREIVDCYEKAISSKTRAIHVTHLINITGQILPVKAIAEMAESNGVEVIVDAAHSFAQLDFKIPDLSVDYFGTSLHKWLCTPLGAGMLYVKKEKISSVWPLFGDTGYDEGDIRKFEHIGTHPVSTNLSISSAIDFHENIGVQYKQARLSYLKSYWLDKVIHLPRLVINSPDQKHRTCAIANVGIKGMGPEELANRLYEDFGVFTVAIQHKDFQGVRVTPHLYTRISHLDQFVHALEMLAT